MNSDKYIKQLWKLIEYTFMCIDNHRVISILHTQLFHDKNDKECITTNKNLLTSAVVKSRDTIICEKRGFCRESYNIPTVIVNYYRPTYYFDKSQLEKPLEERETQDAWSPFELTICGNNILIYFNLKVKKIGFQLGGLSRFERVCFHTMTADDIRFIGDGVFKKKSLLSELQKLVYEDVDDFSLYHRK